MKLLSSDYLYYQGLVGLILGPLLIVLFIQTTWVNNFSDTAVFISYAVLAIFIVFQWSKCLRTKRILYDRTGLLISTYFTNSNIKIPMTDVVSIIKVFSFYRRDKQRFYKLKFMYESRERSIYFYKGAELNNVDDVFSFIGASNK